VNGICVESPLNLFEAWFDEAKRLGGRAAEIAALATVGADHRPSARMINYKGLREGGFSFFTNYESQKGTDLESYPWAALVFHWAEQKRQVRIEGECKRLLQIENENYFASRSRESRITVLVSQQSRPLPYSYKSFLKECEQAECRLIDLTRPLYWGGYKIIPDRIEFWESGPARRHYRKAFVLSECGWRHDELYP
jgi:pyridoxamine 5'-phosphate oxidase